MQDHRPARPDTCGTPAHRAGDVLLAALTYLIEAADEHAAPWGWCR